MTDEPIDPAAVEQQTQMLGEVAADLHRDHTERLYSNSLARKAAIVGCVLAFIDLAGIGILGIVAKRSFENGKLAVQNSKLAVQNSEDIKEVLSVIDPDSPAGKAAAVRTAASIQVLLVEGDCRNRRAIAHLPPPAEGEPCALPDDD